MEVVRKVLTPLEIVSADRRYNADDDVIEYSPDGGTTWVEDEASDPRHSDIFRRPPLTGGSAKCDAAARIVHSFKDLLLTLNNSVTAAVFATNIMFSFLLLAPGAGILAGLALVIFDALTTIGLSNINAAFTEGVWDDIECIIYNNIGEDGQVSLAQRDNIMSDIASAHPGVVYNTLVNIVNLFGEVLMSNAGVEYDDTGDCDGCGWCVYYDLTLSEGGFYIILGEPRGEWVSGIGFRASNFGNSKLVQIEKVFPSGTLVDSVHVFLNQEIGHPGGSSVVYWNNEVKNSDALNGEKDLAFELVGEDGTLFVNSVMSNNGSYTGHSEIWRVAIGGHGTKPTDGTGDCD